MSLFDDIDDCHFIWNSLYNDIIDHHLPSRKAKIRSKSLPWTDVQKASNPKKVTGPDLVSPRDLFFVFSELVAYSLLPLYKNSLNGASFSDNWKLSHVTPVFKKGKPCDVNNYRPISLLSIPGKILWLWCVIL